MKYTSLFIVALLAVTVSAVETEVLIGDYEGIARLGHDFGKYTIGLEYAGDIQGRSKTETYGRRCRQRTETSMLEGFEFVDSKFGAYGKVDLSEGFLSTYAGGRIVQMTSSSESLQYGPIAGLNLNLNDKCSIVGEAQYRVNTEKCERLYNDGMSYFVGMRCMLQ